MARRGVFILQTTLGPGAAQGLAKPKKQSTSPPTNYFVLRGQIKNIPCSVG